MEYLHLGLCEKVEILLVPSCQGNWRETPSPVHYRFERRVFFLPQEASLNSAGNKLFFFRFTADGLVTSEGDKWNFSFEPFTLCKWMTTFQSLFYELRIESGLIFPLGLNLYLADVFYIAYLSYQINVDIQENLNSKKTHFCILLKTFNLFYTMRCFVLLLIEIDLKGQYNVKKLIIPQWWSRKSGKTKNSVKTAGFGLINLRSKERSLWEYLISRRLYWHRKTTSRNEWRTT